MRDEVVGVVAGSKPLKRRRVPGNGLVRELDYVSAAELQTDEQQFDDELVEGLLPRGGMSVCYGDSNTGKSFLMLDLVAAVAGGFDWMGRRTVEGLVLYLATEAPTSVEMRAAAYQRHHGVRLSRLIIVRSPLNLFDGEGDVTAVLALVAELEAKYGRKVVLIVADTLARISAGANENSGEDMGVVLKHAEAIRSGTGAAFVWIHHTGKDAARGMRGWSGMRAAIDTEIEVTADDSTGIRALEITKQRDLPGKGSRIGFKLESVRLGVNRWGSERTSCVVLPVDAPPKPERARRPSEVAGAIVEFLSTLGRGCKKRELVEHFKGRHDHSVVYREVRRMVEDGRLVQAVGSVALPAGK